MNKTFLIVGSIVLVGAGVGAYFLMKPKSTSTSNTSSNNTPSIADVVAQQNALVAQTNATPPTGTILTTPQQVKAVLDNTTKANDLAKAQGLASQLYGMEKALPNIGTYILASDPNVFSCKGGDTNTSIYITQSVYDCMKRSVSSKQQYRDIITQLSNLGYNYSGYGSVTEKAK